LLKRT